MGRISLTIAYPYMDSWRSIFGNNQPEMKNIAIALLLLGGIALAGCTTTRGHLWVETTTVFPPLPDTATFVLLPKRPKGPVDGIRIGRAVYAQRIESAASTAWTRDLFVDSLRTAALERGANLAKVTSFMWETMRDGEHFTVELYRVPDIRRYQKEEVVVWSTRRHLRFDDFKSPVPVPEDPSVGQSRSTYELASVAQFHDGTSWIDRASKDSLQLLGHEQGLFDLCEIYCRQYRQAILRQDGRRISAFDTIHKAWMAKRSEYEWQTSHGLDQARQAEWTARINQALQQGTVGVDSEFDVK